MVFVFTEAREKDTLPPTINRERFYHNRGSNTKGGAEKMNCSFLLLWRRDTFFQQTLWIFMERQKKWQAETFFSYF
jgi:hypothetical protein